MERGVSEMARLFCLTLTAQQLARSKPKVLIGLLEDLHIREYIITYSWISHYITVNIKLNIHGYLCYCVLKICFSDKYFVTLRSNQ